MRPARHAEQLRSLQGEWSFISIEVGGMAMPAAGFASAKMLIDGDRSPDRRVLRSS